MTVATIGKFMNRPFAYQTAATVRLDEIISSVTAVQAFSRTRVTVPGSSTAEACQSVVVCSRGR